MPINENASHVQIDEIKEHPRKCKSDHVGYRCSPKCFEVFHAPIIACSGEAEALGSF